MRTLSSVGCVLLLALAFTLVHGRHGWSGLDDGFVTGQAWRVLQGEVPHRDFVSVRPAGSALLHAVPLALLPRTGAVLVQRFLCALAMAAAAFAASTVLVGRLRWPGAAPRPWAFTALAFTFALQGFPLMPWHAVDGVLLGSLGLWSLDRARGRWGLVAGTLLVVVAALCKQSFAFLVPAALLFVLVARGRRAALTTLLTILGAGLGGLLLLTALDALSPMLEQVTGQTGWRSLVRSGLTIYLRPGVFLAAPFVVLAAAAARLGARDGRPRRWLAAAPAVLLAAALAAAAVRHLRADHWQHPPFGLPAALLVIGVAVTAWLAWRREAAAATLGVFLALAWCSALSWGHATPVLCGAPLLAGFAWMAARAFGTPPRSLVAVGFLAALVLQWASYRHPYRDEPRARLTADLGEAHRELAGVRSSPEKLALLLELAELRRRHPGPATVLPGLPAADWLAGQVPRAPVDWALNSETGGRPEAFLSELRERAELAFVERSSFSLCRGRPTCSDATMDVVATWRLVEAGRHLDVYRRP